LSGFYLLLKTNKDKLKIEEDKLTLKTFLDSFSRTITWFLGLTAYKLIRIKEPEKEGEKKEKEEKGSEKMQDLIL